MMSSLPALLVGASLVIPVANGVPTINVTPSCKQAASGSLGLKQDIEACMASENNAREALVKQWSEFQPADRRSCYALTTTGTPGTYTELLTCLEMKRDARKLPHDDSLETIGQSKR